MMLLFQWKEVLLHPFEIEKKLVRFTSEKMTVFLISEKQFIYYLFIIIVLSLYTHVLLF